MPSGREMPASGEMSSSGEIPSGGEMRSDRDAYHPVQRSLSVYTASTMRPAAETNIRFSNKWNRRRKYADTADVYERLVGCYSYLPNPAADVIYPKNVARRIRTKGSACQSQTQVTEIAPRCPIVLPTCCDFHKGQVHNMVLHHRQYLYNSPEPPDISDRLVPTRLERLSELNRRQNTRNQFPITTVSVRWRNSNYNFHDMYDMLVRFGPIECIQRTGPDNAVVIYSKLEDSCKAVSAMVVGRFESRLFCRWYHRSMATRTFYCTGSKLRTLNNDLVCPSK